MNYASCDYYNVKMLQTLYKPLDTAHRAQSHTPYPPFAQSRVWWSVRTGGGRSRSTAPREPFLHVRVRSGRARYQRRPPTLLVSHTAARTPLPCSPLWAGRPHPNLMFGAPVEFPRDTTGVRSHLKYQRFDSLTCTCDYVFKSICPSLGNQFVWNQLIK